MPTPIAELLVTVGADVTGAIGGINSLNSSVASLSDRFDRARLASAGFAAAGGAIFAGLTASIKSAADFEQSIANVKSVMSPGEVGQFSGALENLAQELGVKTVFSATEAAGGIENLLKAGISAQSILGGAGKAALDLAAATGSPVAESATLAAQAMNTFGITADRLPEIVNTLVGSVNASAADMSNLRLGLSDVGSVAHSLGISLENTGTALALFSNHGLTANTAGTALKTMLFNLVPGTEKQEKAFKSLGLSTQEGTNLFYDQAGALKPLDQVFGLLQNRLKSLNPLMRQQALEMIFGTQGAQAAAIALDEGAQGFNELKAEILSINAATVAETRLNSLQGTLSNLGSTFELVKNIIGVGFLPPLRGIAEAVRGALGQFINLPAPIKEAIPPLLAIIASVLSAIGGFGLFGGLVVKFGPSFIALAGLLASLTPVFLALGAVAGILAAAWQADLGGIQGIVGNAFNRLPDVLAFIMARVEDVINIWGQKIVPAVRDAGSAIGGIMARLKTVVGPPLEAIGAGVQRVAAVLGNGLGKALELAFAGNFEGAGNAVLSTLALLIPGFGDVVRFIRDEVGPRIAGFAKDVLPLLIDGFGKAVAFIRDEVGPKIKEFTDNVLPFLVTKAQEVKDFWDTKLVPAFQTVKDFITNELVPKIQDFVDNTLPLLISKAQEVKDFWDTQLTPAFEGVKTFLADKLGPGISKFTDEVLPKLITVAGDVKKFWEEELVPVLSAPIEPFDKTAAAFEVSMARIRAEAAKGGFGEPGKDILGFFDALGQVGSKLAPFNELSTSFSNFVFSLKELGAAVAGFVLRNFFQQVSDGEGSISIFGRIGEALDAVGPGLRGIGDAFNAAAAGIRELGKAFNESQNVQDLINRLLPQGRSLVGPQPTQGGPGAPASPGGGGRGGFFNTAFVPGGAGGGVEEGAITVNFNAPVTISNGIDLEQLTAAVAAGAREAASRIIAPVPAGQPGLVGELI